MAIADREKVVSDRDLADVDPQDPRRRRIAGTTATRRADFNATPAEVGYGHGV